MNLKISQIFFAALVFIVQSASAEPCKPIVSALAKRSAAHFLWLRPAEVSMRLIAREGDRYWIYAFKKSFEYPTSVVKAESAFVPKQGIIFEMNNRGEILKYNEVFGFALPEQVGTSKPTIPSLEVVGRMDLAYRLSELLHLRLNPTIKDPAEVKIMSVRSYRRKSTVSYVFELVSLSEDNKRLNDSSHAVTFSRGRQGYFVTHIRGPGLDPRKANDLLKIIQINPKDTLNETVRMVLVAKTTRATYMNTFNSSRHLIGSFEFRPRELIIERGRVITEFRSE